MFKEGSVGDKFYLIIEGKVSVSVMNEGKPFAVGTLQPGNWFGEMGMWKGSPSFRVLFVMFFVGETIPFSWNKKPLC